MKGYSSDIKEAFHFGARANGNHKFITFFIKVILMMIPAMILGHYMDQFVAYLQHISKLGNGIFQYVLVQAFFNIILIYELYKIFGHYADEFQTTAAGLFFGSLFWSVQTNFIENIQKLLGTLDRSVKNLR